MEFYAIEQMADAAEARVGRVLLKVDTRADTQRERKNDHEDHEEERADQPVLDAGVRRQG